MGTTYPKVTIVSFNPLRDDRGNGIMMKSLFAGWPRERLSQVYFQVLVPHRPVGDDCYEYRVIDLTGSARRISGKRDLSGDRPAIDSPVVASKMVRRQRLVQSLKRLTWGFDWAWTARELWMAHSWIGRTLERQLSELKPDVVYALLGTYSMTRITTMSCARLKIPLFIHVVDDFVRALYRDRPLSSQLQAASQRCFSRAVALAGGLATISPPMAEIYSRRYQRAWNWYTTFVDANSYDPSPTRRIGSLILVYAGNLELGRWEALNALILALKRLRDEGDIEARLHIYTSDDQLRQYGGALEVSPVTELHGWAPPAELPSIFHHADVLVHVESFQPAYAEYTKYSFSTKLSQYMMAGRCILAFGPADLGSMRVLRDAGAAFIIGDNHQEAILTGLRRLLIDPEIRQRLGRNGRAWAMKNVESYSGRERFRRHIVETLEHGNH